MKIIFYYINNEKHICFPNQSIANLLGIERIAKKDVPKDVPYWIIDTDEIGNIPLQAIEIDQESEADGYGEELPFTEEELQLIKENILE